MPGAGGVLARQPRINLERRLSREAPSCEHVFVTSQGTAHGRFTRFIQQRNVFQAELAARELGQLSLENALALVALYAEAGEGKFERAAVRWLRRLLDERELSLGEARRGCEWLELLEGEDAGLALTSLAGLVHRR